MSFSHISHETNFCCSVVGRRIFHFLRTRHLKGLTGQVAFDDNGDRMYAEYEVINIREHQRQKVVGSLKYDEVMNFTKYSIS